MDIQDGSIVLDLGCGFCRAYPLLNEHSQYYGCDISEEMIHEAKNNFPELIDKLTVSEAETLPYANNYFDVLLFFGVFDALYQEEALMEMLRVLKIDGKLILTGKNTSYKLDDDKAYIAEIRAREKMHPNYFTNVKKMQEFLKPWVKIISEKYIIYRGDFAEYNYTNILPEQFYEYVLIIQKTHKITENKMPNFSDKFSVTFRLRNKENSI